MSDVVTDDATIGICERWRKSILAENWEGKAQANPGCSWPTTAKPEPNNWRVWQRALMIIFALDKHHCLKEMLGKWRAKQGPVVGWYVDHEMNQLYHYDRNK